MCTHSVLRAIVKDYSIDDLSNEAYVTKLLTLVVEGIQIWYVEFLSHTDTCMNIFIRAQV